MIYGVYKCCTNKRKKSKKDKQFDEEEVQKVEKE
jgi:hypothetical protein